MEKNVLSNQARYLYWAAIYVGKASTCIVEAGLPIITGVRAATKNDTEIAQTGQDLCKIKEYLIEHLFDELKDAAGEPPFQNVK